MMTMKEIEFDWGFKDCEYYALLIPFFLVFNVALGMIRKVEK